MNTPTSKTGVKLKYTLALYVAIVISSVFYMSYFYDGSSISKYICKQHELTRVKDANVTAYSDKTLYGDPINKVPDEIDLQATGDSETGFLKTETIRKIDDTVILIITILAWLMLIPQANRIPFSSFLYLFIGAYLLAISYYKSVNGGAMFTELAVPAHATRWLPCFALWILLLSKTTASQNSVKYLLITAASLTFATHGYEAFMQHPHFRGLLYGAFEVISVNISETTATVLLRLIGVMDICLAIAVIFYHSKWKWLLLWMSIWGFLTAISRPIAFGFIGIDDAVLRIGNGLIPLIIYFLVRHRFKPKHYQYA